MFKIKKPTTPSQRHSVQLTRTQLTKKPLIKKNIKIITSRAFGRNTSGKITVRHKGGGHKRRYRKINFIRNTNSIGIITSIEYDPNRNSYIASVCDIENKQFFYILAPKNLKIGDIVKSGLKAELKIGHSLPISNVPVGSYIHNISTTPNTSSQLSRAAGTFSKITENRLQYAKIDLSSGESKFISPQCYVTIGIVSNELIFLTKKGKAGRSRWCNNRPTVRGVAMNPVDHPHGGGEGKKSGKDKTPWGKNNKQGKTSNSKKTSIC